MQSNTRVFGSFVILAILAVAAVVTLAPVPKTQVGQNGNLLAFNSYGQMRSFVSQASTNYQSMFSTGVRDAAFAFGAAAPSHATSTSGFTTTNIQVEGVDEPDLVKTDGTFLYVASGSNVSVILTHPAGSPTVVSTLRYGGQSQVLGLFISRDRLVVVVTGSTITNYTWTQTTSLVLYDVSDPSRPVEIKALSVDGNYIDSRMTNGFVYAILQQASYLPLGDGSYSFAEPQLKDGKTEVLIEAADTYYNPRSLVPMGQYTIIITMSLADGSHTQQAILSGWGSTVYATSSNIYLAFPDRMNYPIYRMAFAGGVAAGDAAIAFPGIRADLMPPIFWWGWGTNTTIFKVGITGDHTNVTAQGTIPGTVLNQFSLDEHKGNLRVATNSYSTMLNQTTVQLNNVYVLDSNLKVMGALEGLAPNERIYAVRFLGDVGYVVTYERIDPLFTISFTDPTHPVVLSALEVTGFSDYLHPIGNGYLIGVGKNTVPAPSEQGFVIYLGVKVSIFHVAPNGSSSETDRALIGDRGSYTQVSDDHRSFTYDPVRGIAAIPVYVVVLDNSSGTVPWWEYGKGVFQGAYLFNVTATGGIQKLGTITQIPAKMGVEQGYDLYINRILIIGDFVYTVSNRAIQVNSLGDMSLVGSVDLLA